MKRKVILITAVLLCAILTGSLFPFETTDVPEWRIRVVDQSGRPVSGVTLRQYWKNYTLETEPGENTEEKQTDANGYVQFDRRAIKATLARRSALTALRLITSFAHGSRGVSARVVVLNPLTTLEYEPGQPVPGEVKIFR